jgi:hypothetical protein
MEPRHHRSPILVTLVHGTFDRDARWTRPESEICKELKLCLGERLYLQAFQWSGKNSEKARSVAVKQFIDHITAQNSYFPSSPHFLIGHSHRGNIIKQALEEADKLRDGITGVVTISTPFIRYEPRNILGAMSQLFWIWGVILTAAVFLLSLYILGIVGLVLSLLPIPFLFLLIVAGAVVLAPCEYILIKAYLDGIRSKIEIGIKARWETLLRARPSAVPLLNPFLCIFTPTDEVNLIIKGTYATTFAWRVAEWVGKFLARPGRAIFSSQNLADLSGAYLIFGGIFFFFVIGGNMTGHGPSWTLAQAFVLPAILMALVLSLGIPIAVMWALSLFGTSSVKESLAVSIRASMQPNGVKNVRFVSISAVTAARISRVEERAHRNHVQ